MQLTTLKLLPALLVCCWICAAEPVEVKRAGNQIDVTIGGKPFTTYFFKPQVAKPYLMPLRSAAGTIVTRGYPVGNEVPPGSERDRSFEPHQRPLYFAHGQQGYGRMAMEKVDEASGGADAGVIRAEFSLNDPSGRVIAEETQEYTFRGDDRTRIIDCQFTIRATHGPVTLGDSKEGTFG